jgi:hypothetical protein
METLDGRVTERGKPVPATRLHRGWFVITRADGPDGVLLEVRVPGYARETQPHPDQAAARQAASEIYDGYLRAIKSLAG